MAAQAVNRRRDFRQVVQVVDVFGRVTWRRVAFSVSQREDKDFVLREVVLRQANLAAENRDELGVLHLGGFCVGTVAL